MNSQETETLGTGTYETYASSSETALQPVGSTDGGIASTNGYEEEVKSGFVQELDDAGLTDSTIAE